MARKDPKDLTVEEKLKALFQLQTTLSQIDEKRALRGELPLEVEDLENEVEGLSVRLDRINQEAEELTAAVSKRKADIEEAKASLDRYNEQLNDVKNTVREKLKEIGQYNYTKWETTSLSARTLLKKDGPKVAIIVSAVTFGIGHIVNLLAGMATVENLMMIVFAVAWGFIFTMVYYKSGNLLLCILVHSVIDVLSTIAGESELGSWIYIGATVVLGGAYSLYLAKRVGTPELQKS